MLGDRHGSSRPGREISPKMHSFFATLFTLVFSLSHAASLRHSGALDGEAASFSHRTSSYLVHSHLAQSYTPSRRELVHAEFLAASYAGSGCVSCRRSNSMSAAYKLH